ncbi:MAG TPA: hypothetical protein VM582_01985, partial [Candidatus Thermoplasmatota archaeon]|nr:hypothetical protein [Candidatus Thermoplasmatota archaeon]
PMIRPRSLLALGLVIALSLVAVPATASHNNQGTVKVHDNEDENPDVRNVPHVSCDFWIEGFKLGDDSGWIRFYAWPPTGDKSEVTPTGASLNWEADSGDASGEYHFLSGPFFLPAGHYRVEVFTHDGHPGSDSGHFAKSKTFWVTPCAEDVVTVPCPVIIDVTATSDDGDATITLSWEAVAGADAYVVYRALPGGDFEAIGDTTQTSFVDADVTVGTTYEYYVTAVIGDVESENCAIVSATAIPFFPTLAVGALALLGGVGALMYFRRN